MASGRNFATAADHLRVSQSALTRRIQELERIFGVALFLRDAHSVRMTTAGGRLLPEAQRLIEAASRCHASVAIHQDDLKPLRIGSHPLNLVFQPTAMAQLRRLRPDVTIEITNLLPSEAVMGLESGTLDIAFIGAPMPRHRPELRQRTLCQMRLSAAVVQGHPIAHNTELPWCALDGQSLILPARKKFPLKRRWIEECLRRSRIRPRSISESVDSADPFTQIGDGKSVALVFDDLRQLRLPGVQFVLLNDPVHLMDFTVAWHRLVDDVLITQLVDVCKASGIETANAS